MIEFGTMSLAKTATSRWGKFRPFLQETINIHEWNRKLCNSDKEYHDEIWLKIGGIQVVAPQN